VGTLWCLPHLLLFDHAFADHLVDGGFRERGGDGLVGAAAFAVVGDAPGVGAQVAVELVHRLEQFGWLAVGVEYLQVGGDVLDGPLVVNAMSCFPPAGPRWSMLPASL
jgi:hypothetical protein